MSMAVPDVDQARLAPAGSSDTGVLKRFRFQLRSQSSGVNTADVRPRTQGGIAPIVGQTKDHIVLDLKDGHPCTILTALTLWCIFFFPYSPLFLPTIAAGLYIAYRQLGYSVWLAWAALNVLFLLLPPYYNRAFREEYFRRLYITLAHYANSSRAVIPAKQYPPGKRYIFGLHPHGRVMYSTALISQLHDVYRRVLPEGGGDVFGAIAAAFFYVPFIRSKFRVCFNHGSKFEFQAHVILTGFRPKRLYLTTLYTSPPAHKGQGRVENRVNVFESPES